MIAFMPHGHHFNLGDRPNGDRCAISPVPNYGNSRYQEGLDISGLDIRGCAFRRRSPKLPGIGTDAKRIFSCACVHGPDHDFWAILFEGTP